MSFIDTVTIASSGSVSGSLALRSGSGPVRLYMPAAWTAAAITMQESIDGGTTWLDLYAADGTEYSLTVAASRAIIIPPANFPDGRLIRFRSGTAATPVTQASARTLTILSRLL